MKRIHVKDVSAGFKSILAHFWRLSNGADCTTHMHGHDADSACNSLGIS